MLSALSTSLPVESARSTRFETPTVRLPAARRGADGPPLRLAHLSDLHAGRFGAREERLLEEIRRRGVDLVAITGDTLGRGLESRVAAGRLIDGLSRLCPVFLCRGNWDVEWVDRAEEFRRLAGRWGARALINEYCTLSTRAGQVRLAGVDDLTVGWPDLEAALDEDGARADFSVLLSHSPLAAPLLPADAPVELMLSGHTHGGQIRLPLLWKLPLRAGYRRYVEGLFRLPWGHLYVNRGFGTVGLPVRVACPSEVAFFELGGPDPGGG